MNSQYSPDHTQKRQHVVSVLHYIAIASAIFAIIMCVLIVVNFIQIKRTDPLNLQVMKVMVDRMHANPADEQLRHEIREIDLLARKAFFTSQWQIRMGGYLLFFSLLIVVICEKSIELLRKKLPEFPVEGKTDFWITRKINRTWIIYTGIFVVIFSFLLVFLTHRELGKALEKAFLPTAVDSTTKRTGMQPMKTMQAMETMQIMKGEGVSDSAGNQDTITPATLINTGGYPSQQEIAQNFPSFRGLGGNGIAFQKNIPVSWDGKSGKNVKWKTEIPLPGYNSPIIWNERVFLTGANETKREVYCFDLQTGKILWRKSVLNIPGSPSKEPKIISETGYSAPTMTTDGRRVYAIFANGDLLALDMEGNQVWAKNLGMPQNHYGHSSSLIMYQDLLIIQYDQRGSGKVMALSGSTGETVWQTNRDVKVSWASPVVVNTGKRTELILVADPMVASYNPASGKELWRMACISGEVGPSVAYADGVVYAVNDFSKLSATEIGDPPKLLWEDTDFLSDIPSPLATGKYLFLVTSYGAVVCYDSKNGTKYWEQELGTPVFASPMLAEGKVFLMDKNGVMHIFKASQEYQVVSQPPLGEGSSCTPAFADGRIIIRGDKNLYCIGK
ncbi:MAG: PQQ-binding-like beta-propeller repeat protein [Bacteroidales bacterium]|nr:PQQ-binding-like beta-propeller repeat protein [Bacteroidales bacterium]